MDSFNLKLERIGSAKEAIKTSLINKGMSPSDNIEDYAQIIDSIESGSGDVKQFATIEEMQADTTAKEGDLAVVYRSEVQNATVDSKFQTATFPETVVLDTAITNYVEISYRAVDSSKMFDCMGSLDSSSFMMDCYTDSGSITIQYTSSDGITYTRTDSKGNPVDFGTEIYYERAERWDDAIGKFIQVSGTHFEGLYEYGKCVDKDYVQFIPVSSVSFNLDNNSDVSDVKWDGTKLSTRYNVSELVDLIDSLYTDTSFAGNGAFVFLGTDDMLYTLIVNTNKSTCGTIFFNTNKEVIGIGTGDPDINYSAILYKIDITNKLFTNMGEYSPSYINHTSTSHKNYYYPIIPKSYPLLVMKSSTSNAKKISNQNWLLIGETNSSTVHRIFYSKIGDLYIPYVEYNAYFIAPTQLSATSDYVYKEEFYGKNGVEAGTLGTPDNSFTDVNAEIAYKIQNAYENMEPRVLTDDDRTINKNIYFIPVKKDGTVLLNTSSVINMANQFYNCKNLAAIPLLDTSSATYMNYMFGGCINLTTIPELNTSKVLSMVNMVQNCANLSDESLNNILAMCANATSYTGTKTLKQVGLTSEQVTRCATLSNYQTCLDAGWTTGY